MTLLARLHTRELAPNGLTFNSLIAASRWRPASRPLARGQCPRGTGALERHGSEADPTDARDLQQRLVWRELSAAGDAAAAAEPRGLDRKLLARKSEGLLGHSACIGGGSERIEGILSIPFSLVDLTSGWDLPEVHC